MVPCTRLLWKKSTTNYGSGVTTTWKSRKCAKKSTRFFRVDYLELNHWRRGEDKQYDIFAMCEVCAAEAIEKGRKFWFPKKLTTAYSSGSNYQIDCSAVHGLRGTIRSFEEVQGVESTFRNDVKERHCAHIKAGIQRMMRQAGNKSMNPDDWERIFKDLYEEFVVESVLHS